MLAKTLKRYGARITALYITLPTIILSVLITLLVAFLSGEPLGPLGLVLAVLFPLLVLGPILFFYLRILEEVLKNREELALADIRLEKALAKVKELSGMLPFCAYCKRIRNDQDYRGKLDQYIRNYSAAEFSQNFCPECLTKIYPEFTYPGPGEPSR